MKKILGILAALCLFVFVCYVHLYVEQVLSFPGSLFKGLQFLNGNIGDIVILSYFFGIPLLLSIHFGNVGWIIVKSVENIFLAFPYIFFATGHPEYVHSFSQLIYRLFSPILYIGGLLYMVITFLAEITFTIIDFFTSSHLIGIGVTIANIIGLTLSFIIMFLKYSFSSGPIRYYIGIVTFSENDKNTKSNYDTSSILEDIFTIYDLHKSSNPPKGDDDFWYTI